MSASLLTTKFNIPPRSKKVVDRAHLLERLNEGLNQNCLLILISAPAGYGKTTLVSEWLHQIKRGKPEEISLLEESVQPENIAWLTLDQGDDDLGRFLAYLLSALQQFQPEIGKGILAALQTTIAPKPDALATWLINDLSGIPDRFMLVLDDYHTISAQAIHQFIAFLVDHKPAQLCLVIVTRADPPFPLGRLRARGQLTELRQDALRFTLPEAQTYLQSVMRLSLTAEQMATLENRTEGWIAGLQLAALSMRNVSDIPSFISTFSGSHMHIADYLMEEVIAQQPEPIKNFLNQTSILDRLSASLCKAVTGQAQAQETLEKLFEENLFLVPLDLQKEWYRYHALIADLLRKRLHQTQGDRVAELHIRASQWYAENNLLNPAIEHALAGHDYRLAADLIASIGESVIERGETRTLLRWLEALPLEIKHEQPILFIFYGLVLLMCGKPPDAAHSQVREMIASSDFKGAYGELITYQGLIAIMQGKATEAIRLSEQALHHLAPERDFFRSLAADSLGMAYTLCGDTAAAANAFEQAVDISQQSGNMMMMLGALSNLAGLHALHGKLRMSVATYQRVLNIAADRLGNRSQLTGKAFLGLGMLAQEWNNLDDALEYYEGALRMFTQSVEIGLPIVHLSIARVKMNQGDQEGAQAHLEKARVHAQASTGTHLDDRLIEETQVRFWLAQGRLNQAHSWLQEKGFFETAFGEILASGDQRSVAGVIAQQTSYLNLARVFLAEKQPERALEILNPMLEMYFEKGHIRKAIEVLALKALALKLQSDIDSALQALDQALSLAEPEGYMRTFLDEGEPMAQLLYLGATRQLYPTYIGRLLAAFLKENTGLSTVKQDMEMAGNLIEPLSQREVEVLALISEGLSNREIGARLHISLSTVKSHTSQIYSKLNVNNRTQATARARSLGLIPLI